MGSNESSDKVTAVESAPVIATTQDAVPGIRMPLRRASSMFVGPRPTALQDLWAIFRASWLNILITFLPAAWALHFIRAPVALVFTFSFLVALSLGNLRSLACEDLAKHWEYLDGWFAVTAGNSVEFIAAIVALRNGELVVHPPSLVGSILSHLLLVLSLTVLPVGAQIDPTLLMIVRGAWLRSVSWHTANDRVRVQAAITLLSLYTSFVVFQLFSRKHVIARFSSGALEETLPSWSQERNVINIEKGEKPDGTWAERLVPDVEAVTKRKEEIPRSSVIFDIIFLVICIGLTVPILEGLVSSVGTLIASGTISQEWAGLIFIPFISGNTAARMRSIVNGVKRDKLNESIMVPVASCIQLALFHIPLVILIGWGMGEPLNHLFDPFESATLLLTVLAMNYIFQDGKKSLLARILHLHLFISAAALSWLYLGVSSHY